MPGPSKHPRPSLYLLAEKAAPGAVSVKPAPWEFHFNVDDKHFNERWVDKKNDVQKVGFALPLPSPPSPFFILWKWKMVC